MDDGSARRRDLCLTAHNTHKKQTSMPKEGFKSQYKKPADLLLRKLGHRVRLISQLSTITLLDRHCHFSTNQLGCPSDVDSYLTAEEYLTIKTEYLLRHSKQSVIGWPSLRTIPKQNSQPVTTDILTGPVCAFLRCLRGASRGSGYLRRNGTSFLVEAARPTGVRLVDQHLCLVRHDICVQNSHPKICQHTLFCHGDTRRGTEVRSLAPYQILTGQELEELGK